MLSPEVFRDNRVLATDGRLTVLHEFEPVEVSRIAGTINIHAVLLNGHDAMFLRAVVTDDGVVVFDLAALIMSLQDIKHTHPLDVPGLIKYTLRLCYRNKSRHDLLVDIAKASKATLQLDPVAAHAPEVQAA